MSLTYAAIHWLSNAYAVASPRDDLHVSCFAYPLRQHAVLNLVDPASSHMLVSKIKPCMSQYKLLYGETATVSYTHLTLPTILLV